jgi:heme/copper-type cytochrome/quinol oxidase subunit 2
MANLAYTSFLLYLIGILEVFFSKCYLMDIISRENLRMIAIIEGVILFIINYLIFNYHDKYKKIEAYFDKKGNRTTSIIGYIFFLILVVALVWFSIKVCMMGRPGADWQIPK